MIADRDRVRARFAPLLRGRGLEIGALNLPFPFLPGTEVLYSDVLSRDQVLSMYPGARVPDIQSDSQAFPTLEDDSLDFIVANHVLEHVTSPIDALREWHRLLRDGGTLMLALPDKRFTFDAPRKRTTLQHLIDDSRSTSNPRDRNYSHLVEWAMHVEKLTRGSDEWQRWIDDNYARGYAVHNHVWIARDILELLIWLDEWQLALFKNTSVRTNEFIIFLRAAKGSKRQTTLHLALARAWLAEPLQIAKALLKRAARRWIRTLSGSEGHSRP